LGDPTSRFRERSPQNIRPNPKVGKNPSDKDAPASSDNRLPTWAKWIIGCNVVMVHLIVIMTGFEAIPFTLNDVPLAAYIVISLGVPVGLANQTIRVALEALFGIKS